MLWVWFGHLIPDASDAQGLVAQLYRLTGVLGTAILLTMLSFAGYVLGLLLSSLHLDWQPIRAMLPEPLRPLSWQSVSTLETRYIVALDRASDAGLSKRALVDIDRIRHEAMNVGERRSVPSDIPLAAMRLQGTLKDIYDDYDRFKSEGEFRRSIALPLSTLIVSAAMNVAGATTLVIAAAWTAGVLVFLVMHALSWRKSREANDLIIQCILSGQVKSPTLEAIEAEVSLTAKRRKS